MISKVSRGRWAFRINSPETAAAHISMGGIEEQLQGWHFVFQTARLCAIADEEMVLEVE
jgi:hypothetical protein